MRPHFKNKQQQTPQHTIITFCQLIISTPVLADDVLKRKDLGQDKVTTKGGHVTEGLENAWEGDQRTAEDQKRRGGRYLKGIDLETPAGHSWPNGP